MSNCTECGVEIKTLVRYEEIEEAFEYDGQNYTRNEKFDMTNKRFSWACPKCARTLFRTEEEANAFLKGKK